jgi:hypothetical protein
MIIYYDLQILQNQSPRGGSLLASHHSGDYSIAVHSMICR